MKFTCIIGTYNPNLEWLERAIDSSFDLFDEYIVFDDGSSKNVFSELQEKLYPNKKWIRDGVFKIQFYGHQQNKGFYEAKNRAIEKSTGDIICTLDDDDYFDRNGVMNLKKYIFETTECCEAMQKEGADVWHFKLQKFGNEDGIYGEGGDPKNLTSFNSIPGISWFRREVWKELGGFDNIRAEDWGFWLKAFKSGKTFTYFPEVVYNMNVRNGSVSRSWGVPFEQIRQEVMDSIKK